MWRDTHCAIAINVWKRAIFTQLIQVPRADAHFGEDVREAIPKFHLDIHLY
jgi:hypothetical protein